MKRKHKRLTFVGLALLLLASAGALIAAAYEENIVFFRSPTDLLAKPPPPDRRLRIGGLIEEGSVERAGVTVRFRVTDMENTVQVTYQGLLPDMFREGQGVVVQGHLRQGVFQADEVLAKHDENYMPPEVAESLKKSGRWRDMQEALRESGQMRPRGSR